MQFTGYHTNTAFLQAIASSAQRRLAGFSLSGASVLTGCIGLAAIAFHAFGFGAIRFALSDLLGEVGFAGMRWATLLALAFTALDLAGLLKLFVRGSENDGRLVRWYLTWAWLLGATLTAVLTWWAVSVAMLAQPAAALLLPHDLLLTWVPVAIAGGVWLVRMLAVGALAMRVESGHTTAVPRAPRVAVAPGRQPARTPVAAMRRYHLPGEPRPVASLPQQGYAVPREVFMRGAAAQRVPVGHRVQPAHAQREWQLND